MIWLPFFLSFVRCITLIICTAAKHPVLPVDCDDLDNWDPVDMATAPKQEQQSSHSLQPNVKQYRAGESISVIADGSIDFIDVVVQARPMSHGQDQPLGIWAYDDIIEAFSCQGSPSNTAATRTPIPVRRVRFEWLPLNSYGPVQFVALVTESDGRVVNIVSDVITPDNITAYPYGFDTANIPSRRRLKRDIQGSNTTKNSDETNADSLTTENPLATESSPPVTVIDWESFFYYFTIVGAYVGMYTIFSLLLV